jgi:DNA-binding NarL/FixJ family response regulator
VARIAVPGDLAAADELSAGARAIEGSDPDRAIGVYRAALRLLPDDPLTTLRRADLALAAAHCCVATGRFAAAADLLEYWSGLVPAKPDPRAAACAAEYRAALLRAIGQHDEADELLREAIQLLSDGRDARPRARLRLALAASPQASAETADDALLTATGTGVPVLQAHALALRALVQLAEGASGPARRGAEEAVHLLDQLPDNVVAGRLAALGDLGRAELLLEQFEAADRHLTRALVIGSRTGRWVALVSVNLTLGWVRLQTGRFTDAVRYADEARILAESLEATELAAEVATLHAALWSPDGWHGGFLPASIARRLLAATDADAIAHLCGGADLPLVPAYARVGVYQLMAQRSTATSARRWAEQAEHAAIACRLPGGHALALLARAGSEPEPEQGLELARQAAAAAAAAGRLFDAARARVHIVRSLVQLPDAAITSDFAAAMLAVRQCGAPWLRAELDAVIEAEAMDAGPDDADSSVPTLTALTPREQQVAQLVSQGRTNRQIARKLTLSHKTVETHLGRIFNKLNVSSRAEIANLVGRAAAPAPHSTTFGTAPCPYCGAPPDVTQRSMPQLGIPIAGLG